MAKDPEIRAHQEWLGYVQPVGLVVSPPALGAAQAFPNQNIVPDHDRFLNIVDADRLPGQDDPVAEIGDFPASCRDPRLGAGGPRRYRRGRPLPESLEVPLPEYGETLRPTYAVREPEPSNGQQPWLLLIQVSPPAWTSTSADVGDAAGRPARRRASSGCCARRRSRSASCRTARTCAWSTRRAARRPGT